MRANSTKYKLRYWLIIGALLLMVIPFTNTCFAQPPITLNKVANFELISSGFTATLSAKSQRFEIIRENGSWKCYQTSTRTSGYNQAGEDKPDTLFIKNIAAADLKKILRAITLPDDSVNHKLFKVNKAQLIKYVDSIKVGTALTIVQKKELIEALRSNKNVVQAIDYVTHALKPAHGHHHLIKVITNTRDTLVAYSTYSICYNIPWFIGNKKSYNPNINLLFENMLGISNSTQIASKNFYLAIDRNIYLTKVWMREFMRVKSQ